MNAAEWKDVLIAASADAWARIVAFVPNVVGALAIVGIGYVISRAAERLAAALLRRFGLDRVSLRVGLGDVLEEAGIHAPLSEIMARLVFWLLLLTFLVSAAEALGLRGVSQTIESFVQYLPKVIGAVIILVVGFAVASFVRDLVRSGGVGLGIQSPQALAKLVYALIVLVASTLAIAQLEIETALFNRVIEILLIAAAGSLAIAVGLGTRDVARHMVAGAYLRDLYKSGTRLRVGAESGFVEEVGAMTTRIRTREGAIVYIPNGRMTEMIVRQPAPDAS